jgi:hypothetical protein
MTSSASISIRPLTSPLFAAAKNWLASSSRSCGVASKRGLFASMCRRARTACCRHVAADRPTILAISS